MTADLMCPDCGKSSGDDWSQCESGRCPMPMSPHFGKPADTIEDLDARCGRPLPENPCSICGLPIMGGAFVGTGDGTMRNGGSFAHIDCWRATQGGWRRRDRQWMCRVTCHVAPPNTGDGCTFPICRCEEAKTAPTPFDAALISAAEEIVGRHMVVKLIKYQSGVAGLYREIESMGKIIDKRDAYLDELAKSLP